MQQTAPLAAGIAGDLTLRIFCCARLASLGSIASHSAVPGSLLPGAGSPFDTKPTQSLPIAVLPPAELRCGGQGHAANLLRRASRSVCLCRRYHRCRHTFRRRHPSLPAGLALRSPHPGLSPTDPMALPAAPAQPSWRALAAHYWPQYACAALMYIASKVVDPWEPRPRAIYHKTDAEYWQVPIVQRLSGAGGIALLGEGSKSSASADSTGCCPNRHVSSCRRRHAPAALHSTPTPLWRTPCRCGQCPSSPCTSPCSSLWPPAW